MISGCISSYSTILESKISCCADLVALSSLPSSFGGVGYWPSFGTILVSVDILPKYLGNSNVVVDGSTSLHI